MEQDDDFIFLAETDAKVTGLEPVWKVLIVDDEPDVHQTTVLALKGLPVEGRQLEFVHAYSAQEARIALQEHHDLAVLLLDVVMEVDDAGLQLVRYIRDDLKNLTCRIILRTGQPGYAPEIDTIRFFDINDYKTKSELTRVRLFTCLTAAVRSYWQIQQLESARQGLEQIVQATAELNRRQGVQLLAQGVVNQICSLLDVTQEGLVCATLGRDGGAAVVVAAAGSFAAWTGQSLDQISDAQVRDALQLTLERRSELIGDPTCLYYASQDGSALAVYIRAGRELSAIDHRLVGAFSSNIAVAFENVELYRKLSDLAFEDTLLGIPNRNGLLKLLGKRQPTQNVFAMVDIDGFSDINSALDHNFGDAVLRAVLERIQQTFASSGVTVARVGPDVFALLGNSRELNEAALNDLFTDPLNIGNEGLRLSATSSLLDLEGVVLDDVEMIKSAAVTLKQAKHFKRGQALQYTESYSAAARERMSMLSKLRLAFSAERLFVVYQPFVHLATGAVVGAEALLRWRAEDGRFVPPDRFVPVAEKSGLMVAIGDWVMLSAFGFAQQLIAAGHGDFRIAVNVSHVQFREPNFVNKFIAAMQEKQIDPRRVEIELTESVAIDDIALIEQKVRAIRATGAAVAIDDFGTGYSSLNIIRKLNVNRLKIDRSFVSGEDSEQEDFGIARVVMSLANHLGLESIAEGIETEFQRDKLMAMGCQDGQGYLFSKPLTDTEFLTFIHNRERAA